MPLITSDLEFSDDYPTIEPSLRLDFANTRALDSRISFTRASVGTYVGANGLIKTAGEDEPRFDHDPTTGESLGLLIEESMINYQTYSVDINTGKGFLTGSTLSSNAATAPDGTTTATRITGSGIDEITRLGWNTQGTSNTQYNVFSVFVKADSGTPILGFYSNTFVAGAVAFNIDLSDGSTNTIGGSGGFSSKVVAYPNGWYRVTVMGGPGTGPSGSWNINLVPSLTSARGSQSGSNASSSYFIWGVQEELSSGFFPTSYIPTSGSTVTRAQDTPLITGTTFTDFYNQSEGTLVLSADIGELVTSNQTAVAFEDTSNVSASFIAMGYNAGGGGSGHVGAWYNSSGTTSAFKTHNIGVTINTEFKQSFAYKLDDFSSVVNGGAPLTDNSGGITTLIDRVRFGNYHYGGMSSGHIKQFTYYPKRLTNAQLQTLTQ